MGQLVPPASASSGAAGIGVTPASAAGALEDTHAHGPHHPHRGRQQRASLCLGAPTLMDSLRR